MEHASEIMKQLTTILSPQFNGLNSNVAELKEGVAELRKTIGDLTTIVVTATDDIKALKEKSKENSEKIEALETVTRDNADGVRDYKKTKAACIALAGILAGIFTTIAGYGISAYYENKRHTEDAAYKQAILESYDKLALAVAQLQKGNKN